MKSNLRSSFACVLFAFLAITTWRAGAVTYNFSGIVTSINGSYNPDSISVGDPFTGSLSYDLNRTDEHDGLFTLKQLNGAIYTADVNAVGLFLEVKNNAPQDSFSANSEDTDAELFMGLFLSDSTGKALKSDSLPSDLNLNWDERSVGWLYLAGTPPETGVRGRITSPLPIPDCANVSILFALGILPLVVFGSRKRAQGAQIA